MNSNRAITAVLLFFFWIYLTYHAFARGDTERALVYLAVGVVLTIWRLNSAGLKLVGKKALAKQPDAIHLISAEPGSWKNAAMARASVEAILPLGFSDAGSYTIPELGVKVHFQLESSKLGYGIVYEHPKAGSWINFVSLYQDGTSVTFSNSPRGGALDERPSHPIVSAKGADAASLYERFKAERPQFNFVHLETSQLAHFFEVAYAESVTWRKKKGISAEEVRKVQQQAKQAAVPPPPPPSVALAPILYLARQGQQEGPFTPEYVRAEIAAGRLALDDWGWQEGLPEWVPLSSLLK